jgi:glycosyltransferase involved in cell wall biosynthesis
MRIVLTCNFSPWSSYSGGGQRSTHQLASALAHAGHDVHVVYTRAPRERVEPDVPPPYRIHWAALFDVKSRRNAPLRPLSALSVARAVARLCEQAPVDAVHAQGEEGALVARSSWRRAFCLVVTPRFPWYPAAVFERRPGWRQARRVALWLSEAKYPLLGMALRAADHVCPTSRSAADAVQRAFDLAPQVITVVPNGVAPAFLDAAWTPAPDAPLLFFGRLARDKGADTLIEALAGLDRAPPLIVIGRGDDEPALRALAHARGLGDRVRFEPWAAPRDLAARIAQARMVVLPSRHESFGNAMAEAMAVGAPLVSTTAGSIPEVVDHGRTGVLVPPDDPVALRHALATLLEDPAHAARLGAAGRAHVHATYGWDAVARRFLAIYARGPAAQRARP